MDHLLGFYEKQLQPPSKLQQTIISNADTTLCPDFCAQDATNTCLPPHHGKLSLVLDIPYNQQYPNSSILPQDLYLSLFTAIKHQNIVWWNNFLRGFISSYWYSLSTHAHINESLHHSSFPWDLRLVHAVLSLSHSIWQNCNHLLHGSTMEDSRQRLRQRILDQVQKTYEHPPKLQRGFSTTYNILYQ